MSDVVSDVVSAESAASAPASPPGDGFAWVAGVNDGFLGTGYSSAVELSFIVMVLILGYVGLSIARYFLSGREIMEGVAGALGLRDD